MSDKTSHQISLLNFDPKSQREPIINSPRSLEACRRQGIDPHELLVRTAAEIKEMFRSKNLDKEGIDQMVLHYEERRREKVRVLLEERAVLIEDEKNGYVSFATSKEKKDIPLKLTTSSIQNLLNTKTDSTLIEKEKKQLERIKQRQEKEIKQLIDYESKMGEIKKKQEEKEAEQREKDRLKELENARKRKEAEEKKRLEELEKQRKMEELEQLKMQMAAEAQRKKEENEAREAEKERKRQMELKMREEEQRRKLEEFKRKTETQAQERQNEILRRKEQIELQDKIRQEHLHAQWVAKQKEAEERSRQQQEKLKQAKEKNDELLFKKKLDFDEKQMRNEEKRKLFEFERQKKMEETKKLAEQHAQLIQKVLEENHKLLEDKKEKYHMKKALAEERKRELDLLAEAELKRQQEEERLKEESRKQVKVNMEIKMKEKIDKYLTMMEMNEFKLAKTRQQQLEEKQKKHNLDVINWNDRHENVERRAKMDEYKRAKILEKIQNANERGEKIKQDRAALLEMRKIVKREMQTNKQSLMEQFEKIKRGKLDTEFMPQEPSRPKFSQTTKNSLSLNRSEQLIAKPTDRSTQRRKSIENLKSEEKLQKTERTETSIKPPKQHNQPAQSQPLFDPNLKILTEKEARKALEDLRMKQNQEMLRLLEEEHNKENQREAKLRNITDITERKRYEKSLMLERAKSSGKVQQLADMHESSIRQFMSKYNVKALG